MRTQTHIYMVINMSSMVTLNNIPTNLRYYLFKKNLSAKEFSLQINEPHRTLLAIMQGKITKTNRDLGMKIAKVIGVDLNILQEELLEDGNVSFHTQLPILNYQSITFPINTSNSIGAYSTLNGSLVNKNCFVVQTNSQFNYSPMIPPNCSVVLIPHASRNSLKDGDTLLLQDKKNHIFFRIIEMRKKENNTIISILSNRLQVEDIMLLGEFTDKYSILGKIIEIRHE